jgi:hypothetical protein
MLPLDLGGGLVRVSGTENSAAVGSAFVCFHSSDGSLVLTCRKVIDLALDDAGLDLEGPRTVWIDQAYQAVPVFELPKSDGNELSVLQCTEGARLNRIVLWPLGRPPIGHTGIVSFQPPVRKRKGQPTTMPGLTPYEKQTETEDAIELRNHARYRIGPEHYGSPVVDEERVVGVVTAVAAAKSRPNEHDSIVIAGLVNQLDAWKEKPPDLFEVKSEIFISYAHEDSAIVSHVEASLERRGYRVWRDVHQIFPGDVWTKKLEEILESVRFVLIFCSRHSARSKYVDHEASILMTRLAAANPPVIIPVLLAGGEVRVLLQPFQSISAEDGDALHCFEEVIQAIERHQSRRVASATS